jgi:hypothetical protein
VYVVLTIGAIVNSALTFALGFFVFVQRRMQLQDRVVYYHLGLCGPCRAMLRTCRSHPSKVTCKIGLTHGCLSAAAAAAGRRWCVGCMVAWLWARAASSR